MPGSYYSDVERTIFLTFVILSEDIAKYKGRYKAGWHELKQERYKRMIELGVIDKSFKLPEDEMTTQNWESRLRQSWRT